MEFRILGSFEVVGAAGLLELRGAKRRGLLACLVVHAGRPMSTDRLVEDLWGEAGSAGAARTVQTYVSQLRKLLRDEPARLETGPGGYVLHLDPRQVDAHRFEQALATAVDEPAPTCRLAVLDEALGLWRGPPLGEFTGADWADREARRLEGRHLQATRHRCDTLLELGRATETVAELEALVGSHPLDEQLWAQLMLALYRTGRQADALGAYQQARHQLVDDLGIEPGPELADLEHRILNHDPTLASATDRAAATTHQPPARGTPNGWYPRTYLLTDIVDSVSLWERDPTAMSQTVAWHDTVIQDAVDAAGGELVRAKGEGDSTFSVFEHPSQALAAAADIQAAVAGDLEPSMMALRLRVGVHTGDGQARDGNWYGQAVNRAARLRALAQGGQTLVSGVTAGLTADQLPKTIRLLYQGRRVLRGIERPEEVWELATGEDREADASGPTRIGNLPLALTSFVGRDSDLDAISTLLETERLVTLTGPGGSGKTRLAIEVATRAAQQDKSVWLAELAPLREGGVVAQVVATAVGIEAGSEPLDDLLARPEFLAGLLVLDNCEHLLDACAALATALLAATPELHVLATSREPLGLAGEREWPVGPLDVPDESLRDHEQLTRVESVQLLLDRARAVRPNMGLEHDDVAGIVGICRTLDGIPLAIELAAGRLRSMSPTELCERLSNQMHLLAKHRPAGPDAARHQTLRVTLDWSYDLLTDQQRTLAQRLSVFAGGFRLDAVEAVCGNGLDVLDGVDELVTKSWITFDGVTARHRLLEPLRQYLAERLQETGAADTTRQAHAAWVVDLAEAAERGFFTDQAAWVRRLDAEQANIRAALTGAVDHDDDVTALRIAAALGYPWFTMGQPDARSLLDRALAEAGPVGESRLRARALLAAGMLAQDATDFDAAFPLLEAALALFEARGSRRGQGWTLTWLSRDQDRFTESVRQAMLERALALFRETHHSPGIAWSLAFLTGIRLRAGEVEAARPLAEEAFAVASSAGAPQPLAEALRVLGLVAYNEGDLREARSLLERSAGIHRAGGDRWQEAIVAGQLGQVAALMGDPGPALEHFARAVDIAIEVASYDQFAVLLEGLVPVLWHCDRRDDASQLLGAYDAIRSGYFYEELRNVASQVRASEFDSARASGTALPLTDAIGLAQRAIDEERARLAHPHSGARSTPTERSSAPSDPWEPHR